MRIIDAHTHIGSCKWSGHDGEFVSADESVEQMRSYGIEWVITVPWQAVLCEVERDMDEGNAEALELHAKYPDFIYPGVVVDFRWPQRSLYWLEQFHKERFCWVGEMVPKPAEGETPFTDPAWQAIFECAEDYNMIVQLHNSTGTAAVAKAHPRLQVVGSHLNPQIVPLLIDMPNVMLDISGVHGGLYLNCLKNARRDYGAERLLYGTDYEGYDPTCFIFRVQATFTPEEQKLVFYENICKLIDAHTC
ncbi:MAG: amidohydrolase family protein [Oligosphaeraceae bacterium]|nr:amidohydrolase family protein [Oligosphaeraceae bacterium]